MLKIAADANALGESIESSASRSSKVITETNASMYPATNGINAIPARIDVTEKIQGYSREFIYLAVAATQQIDKYIIWQLRYRMFSGVVVDGVRGS